MTWVLLRWILNPPTAEISRFLPRTIRLPVGGQLSFEGLAPSTPCKHPCKYGCKSDEPDLSAATILQTLRVRAVEAKGAQHRHHARLVPQYLWRTVDAGGGWYGIRYHTAEKTSLFVREGKVGPIQTPKMRFTPEKRLKDMDQQDTEV